jgi:hypothetical protein
MEPIPNVNIDQFRKELLDAWWKGFYGIKSKHAEWWERTSVLLWLRFFELIRKYQIPVPRNMVRMIRATLSYDTVAARLYGKINVFKEFEKYSEGAARQARCRIEASVIRQLLLGPDDSTFLKLQQIANVGNGILYRVQKFLDDPIFNFSAVAGKIYFAIQEVVRLFLACGAGAMMSVIAAVVMAVIFNWHYPEIVSEPSKAWQVLHPSQMRSLFQKIINPYEWRPPYSDKGILQFMALVWLASILLFVWVHARRVFLRFGDTDK